jgi:CHASE3 domain sensor protein
MKISNSAKLLILFILVGFALSCYSVYLSGKSTRELVDFYASKNRLQGTYSAVRDAERAQRYYLLTGDKDYLNTFRENERLLNSFDKDPLNLLIGKKFAEMNQTIRLKNDGKDVNAIALVQTKEGEII